MRPIICHAAAILYMCPIICHAAAILYICSIICHAAAILYMCPIICHAADKLVHIFDSPLQTYTMPLTLVHTSQYMHCTNSQPQTTHYKAYT